MKPLQPDDRIADGAIEGSQVIVIVNKMDLPIELEIG